MSMINVDAGV